MDTFSFGLISVQNWNEVRLLSFITFLQSRSLFVSYPGSGRSWLRSMFEVNRFSLCTILLRSNQFWVLCCALISHKNTDDCVYGSKKTIPNHCFTIGGENLQISSGLQSVCEGHPRHRFHNMYSFKVKRLVYKQIQCLFFQSKYK